MLKISTSADPILDEPIINDYFKINDEVDKINDEVDKINESNDNKLTSYLSNHSIDLFYRIAGCYYGGAKVLYSLDNNHDFNHLLLLTDQITVDKLLFDPNKYAQCLVKWEKTIDDKITIDRYLHRIITAKNYTDDYFCSNKRVIKQIGYSPKTNTSLIRCVPILLCNKWRSACIKQATVTNINSLYVYASYLLTSMLRHLINGHIPTHQELFKNKLAFIKKHYVKEFNNYKKIYMSPVDQILKLLKLNEKGKMRYVLKTIGCAFYALEKIRIFSNTSTKSSTNTSTNNLNNYNTLYNYLYNNITRDVFGMDGDKHMNTAVAGMVVGAYLGANKLLFTHVDKIDTTLINLFNCLINKYKN